MRLWFLILLFIGFSNSYAVEGEVQEKEMKAFYTDLCTGYPEGTRKEPNLWAHCCIKHDLAYWVAGTRDQRKLADKNLRSCVTEAAGKFQGNLMYYGIVVGHASPIKAKTAWGWAWDKKERKKFAPLTEEQKEEALQKIYQSEVEPYLIEEFLSEFPL
ncbi:MAG: hypothetical protein GY909_04635 [Oligoflexia bacterium]|nr:hypothetical protein [Oligoflexia bacterium]